ncbi:hypothetical protein D3C72_1914070 [compost metagenome]
MLDDDALHAERNGLIDHIRLERCILAAVENLKLDAERLCLRLHAGKIGLEEVARREITHERDLHVARLIEGLRHIDGKGRRGKCRSPHEPERHLAQDSTRKFHFSLLHWSL